MCFKDIYYTLDGLNAHIDFIGLSLQMHTCTQACMHINSYLCPKLKEDHVLVGRWVPDDAHVLND